MSNRLFYSIYWARDGEVADPDLDVEHPLYLPNRYQGIGWQVEKPPEQWENFVYQNNDLKIVDSLLNGIQPFDITVSYQVGALTVEDGVLYVNNSGGVLAGVVPSHSAETYALIGVDFILGASRLAVGGWAKVLATSESEFNSFLNEMKTSLANHLAAVNPHNDNIEVIGGVNKKYVDDGFGSPTDPRTITYHTNLLNTLDAHHETPQQLGTLPTSGGTFTGDVTFLSKILFDTDIWIGLVTSVAKIYLTVGDNNIALDSGGNATFNNFLMVTKENITRLQNKLNYAYTLPSPILKINLKTGLSDVESLGDWTIESDADVVDKSLGLEFVTNTITMQSGLVNVDATVYFNGSDGTSSVKTITDLHIETMDDFSAFLSSVGGTATHVGYVEIYPTLTNKQKLNLVV